MGATGATKVTNATTLDLCLSACKSSATCVAVEYSETEKCWMHTTSTYEANLKTNTGVTVYKRISCGEYFEICQKVYIRQGNDVKQLMEECM